MRLVDDDDLVVAQELVTGELGEQDAVGHDLDPGLVGDLRGEAHLVADRAAEVFAEFVGDAFGDRARGDPPRLGVPDHPVDAQAEFEADLRQLRRLARPGLTSDDDDLVVSDRLGDDVLGRADRKFRRIGDLDRVGRTGRFQAGTPLPVLGSRGAPSAAASLRPAAAGSAVAPARMGLLTVRALTGLRSIGPGGILLLGSGRVLVCHLTSQLIARLACLSAAGERRAVRVSACRLRAR